MVESALDFTFSMESGETMCVSVSATDDDIDEPTEQFEFYFVPGGAPVTFGDPSTSCVNIEDNDSECHAAICLHQFVALV